MAYTKFDNNDCRLLIDDLSPLTTEDSLRNYLMRKGYRSVSCKISAEFNGNRAVVDFVDAKTANEMMANRPHVVDNRQVVVHRSISGYNFDATEWDSPFLELTFAKKSLTREQVSSYYARFGTAKNLVICDRIGEQWIIEFFDYDSADRMILGIMKSDEKGIRMRRLPRNFPFQSQWPSQDSVTVPKLSLPNQARPKPIERYQIKVSNLPDDVDAEQLSNHFELSIYDIVLAAEIDQESRSRRCWLRNIDEQRQLYFISVSNKHQWRGRTLIFEQETDPFEFCDEFRSGSCTRTDDQCLGEHIRCPFYENCNDNNCLYGHRSNLKAKSVLAKRNRNFYRIKITGFPENVDRASVEKNLEIEKLCEVPSENRRIAYVIRIDKRKEAIKIMKKLYDARYCGKPIKCNLEIFNNAHGFPQQPRVDPIRLAAENMEPAPNNPLPKDLPKGIEWEVVTEDSCGLNKVLLIRQKVIRKRQAAIKIYSKNERNEAERELMAMERVKDLQGVSHLIDEIAYRSNFYNENSHSNDVWLMTNRVPGKSLVEHFNSQHAGNRKIISFGIELSLELIKIIESIHDKGVYHRNISPSNIMVLVDNQNIKQAKTQITLINFSQAYISNETHPQGNEQPHRLWYNPPQANETRLIKTVDTSGLCAVLYWILTRKESQKTNEQFSRQIESDDLNQILERAMQADDVSRSNSQALSLYLNDTFERAFGYPNQELWSVAELETRLELILNLLIISDSETNTLESKFHLLMNLPMHQQVSNIGQNNILEYASHALQKAKDDLVKSNHRFYSWADGNCQWVETLRNQRLEYRNDDVLMYQERTGSKLSFFLLPITCLSRILEENQRIWITITTSTNGKLIEIPIGLYRTMDKCGLDLSRDFLRSMKDLVFTVYSKRQQMVTN